MNTGEVLECSFRKVMETIKELESEKTKEVTNKRSIVTLENENLKLKEKSISLEKKVNELQARLDRLSSHYQSVLAERDYRNIQDRLMKSAPKLLEEENAALSDKIAKMEIKLFYVEEQKRTNKEKWRLHEQKMDKLIEFMSQLMGRLNGLEQHLVTVDGVCKRLKPTARLLAKRCGQLKLLYSQSRRTIDQLTAQLDEERSQLAIREAQLAGTLGSLRALDAETAGYRAAVLEQRDETMLFKKQSEELRSEIEHLEARLEEHREIIRDQSDALSRLFIA